MTTNSTNHAATSNAEKDEKSPEELEWESRIRLTPQFNQLIQANLEADVIFEMFKLIERGMFAFEDVDEIVQKTITRFTRKQGIQFFKVLGMKDFSHIMRKSHYIVSQMKIFNYYIDQQATIFNGPDQKRVQELLDRTGYSLKVTTGMRQYGGPPPEWDGESPAHREISISKIPDDWYEDKLVPVLEKFGKIYEIRIMIDNITGLTRNFCFVKFCDEQDNLKALTKIDSMWIPIEQDDKNKMEIEGGVTLKANFSTCNKRLFVGNVPKSETKKGFIQMFSQFVEGIEDAEVYVSDEMANVGLENRGFVFLDFKTHNLAAEGKRVLAGIGEKVYEGKMLKVDWAEPAYCPASEETAKVKAIHVSNLSREVTEDLLRSTFEQYGKLFHVQKVRDYAFIHYDERESALKALDEAKDIELCGYKVKVNISTSGPLMRKIKRQNKLAWLRGEFGFGKRKRRQTPPPPRRGRDFHRGGSGGYHGNRDSISHSSGGGQRYGQKRSYDDRDDNRGSSGRSGGGYGRDGGYGGGGYSSGYSDARSGYGSGGGGYGGGGSGYSSGGGGNRDRGSGGYGDRDRGSGGYGDRDRGSGYGGGNRDGGGSYSGGYGQGGGKIRRY